MGCCGDCCSGDNTDKKNEQIIKGTAEDDKKLLPDDNKYKKNKQIVNNKNKKSEQIKSEQIEVNKIPLPVDNTGKNSEQIIEKKTENDKTLLPDDNKYKKSEQIVNDTDKKSEQIVKITTENDKITLPVDDKNKKNEQIVKITTDVDKRLQPKIYKILASVMDKYPSILNRMSYVELYYLCENFIKRDDFNEKKRTDEKTAKKLISFAKGECVDKNDIERFKQYNNDFNFLKEYVQDNNIEEIGCGEENKIFPLKKQYLLPTKHDKNITFAIRERCKNINYNTYNDNVMLQKILLSLFARQTKYYNTFMMKQIKCNKQIEELILMPNIDLESCKDYDEHIFPFMFDGISSNEIEKEVARELLFGSYDHPDIDELERCVRREGKNYYKNPIDKNRMLENNKIINIDLTSLEPRKKEDFKQLIGFVENSKFFDSKKIFSQFKKNLTISPNLIIYHTLMELKKYDFENFNDQQYIECLKTSLEIYKNALSSAKENFKEIDNQIVEICEQQLKIYDKYIEQIKDFTLNDFKNMFNKEQEDIEKEINKYRSMEGTIKGTIKGKDKKCTPLMECENGIPSMKIPNDGKGK